MELAPPDHQVHRRSPEGQRRLQPSESPALLTKNRPVRCVTRALIRAFLLPLSVLQGGQRDLRQAAERPRNHPKQVQVRQDHPAGKPHRAAERPGGITVLVLEQFVLSG